jgi:hypothetical protein
VQARRQPHIETADITRFWVAYDALATARSQADSIATMQTLYIDKASQGFKTFLKKRNFTAAEYVQNIGRFPRFWATVRPLTERISSRLPEIEAVLNKLADSLPGFRMPDVCFAIGCLRTGGTTGKSLILVGAEIAAADSTVNKTSFSAWLNSVVGNTGDIVAMVAHEAVHTQQSGIPAGEIFKLMKHKKLSLLNMCILEGSADFCTQQLLGININAGIHAYGKAHACALAKEFMADVDSNPFNYSKWLYNGTQAKGRPADLGYYIGSEISAGFYTQATNKQKALRALLKRGKYKKVYRRSGFAERPCD